VLIHPSNEAYGWHFQYLTVIGLGLSTLTFACGLLADLTLSRRLFLAKNILSVCSCPMEVLISVLYWGLRMVSNTIKISTRRSCLISTSRLTNVWSSLIGSSSRCMLVRRQDLPKWFIWKRLHVNQRKQISASMQFLRLPCWWICFCFPRLGPSPSFLLWVYPAPSPLAIGSGWRGASATMAGR